MKCCLYKNNIFITLQVPKQWDILGWLGMLWEANNQQDFIPS